MFVSGRRVFFGLSADFGSRPLFFRLSPFFASPEEFEFKYFNIHENCWHFMGKAGGEKSFF